MKKEIIKNAYLVTSANDSRIIVASSKVEAVSRFCDSIMGKTQTDEEDGYVFGDIDENIKCVKFCKENQILY